MMCVDTVALFSFMYFKIRLLSLFNMYVSYLLIRVLKCLNVSCLVNT